MIAQAGRERSRQRRRGAAAATTAALSGARRGRHRPGRLRPRAGRRRAGGRRRGEARARASAGCAGDVGRRLRVELERGERAARARRGQLRRAVRRRGRAAGRRRSGERVSAQGRVPGVRAAGRRGRSSEILLPRALERSARACSCSRRSTACSSRDRPRASARTSATGRWRPTRRELILARGTARLPGARAGEPIGAYAGLRPAGARAGATRTT